MKKVIITCIVVLALLPSTGFWYMEASLFCRVSNQNIQISLSATPGWKCKSYIYYIEQIMRKNARDLYTLQWYITNGQDVDYRQQVKKEKLTEIDKLQVIRLNIIASMKSFESNLLKKSLEFFLPKIAPYKNQLKQSLFKLSSLTGIVAPTTQRYMSLLSGQLQVIDKMATTQTFDELIPLFNAYIYFKQEISWKSE